MWNCEVSSLYRTGSLKTTAKDLAKYRLNLLAVDVRWSKGGNEPVYIMLIIVIVTVCHHQCKH